MKTQFKIGDRVEYISGARGTVLSLTSYLPDTLLIQWDLETHNQACHPRYLKLVAGEIGIIIGAESGVSYQGKCTCPIHDLMNNGCKCGGYATEMERKNK
jgi:hypothetical protein